MPEENEKRKLAAIVYADVKGYSRIMGEDESFTVSICVINMKMAFEIDWQ
jgi:hypothetical protein